MRFEMEILTKNYDKRIDACNILIEMTLEEYYKLSQNILNNNEFQRRRVKSSSSVYSLLKEDIKKECLIPPIVLALGSSSTSINKESSNDEIINLIETHQNSLIILDGLQRTYTIQDLVKELENLDLFENNKDTWDRIKNLPLRIEVYTGINKFGILYRMLTLNTGQTPMSARHQIEIIYSDCIDKDIEGIKLVNEVDNYVPKTLGEYRFRDIIEGFTSYIEKDYMTMDRSNILENIKSLEQLSKENSRRDVFIDFLKTYHEFVKKICELGHDWSCDSEIFGKGAKEEPFGRSTLKIFNKSQVMTGFGSAVGKLIEIDAIKDFDELSTEIIPNIISNDIYNDLNLLITNLEFIRKKAKKIGNDQRLFFEFFFKALFDKQKDSYLNLNQTIEKAMQSYYRETY